MSAKRIHIAVLMLALLVKTTSGMANALADPTRPSYPALPSTQHISGPVSSNWHLNSTLVSPHRRVAVINGIHVSEGESVANATVLKIRKLDVVIQVSGQRITLPLLPDIVKRLP
jgi:hypothetical protein